MRVFLDGEDVSDRIRTPEVSAMASRISALEPVRRKMVEAQRRIARDFTAKGGGVVVEGRDIGTVVFPDAEDRAKFFSILANKADAPSPDAKNKT